MGPEITFHEAAGLLQSALAQVLRRPLACSVLVTYQGGGYSSSTSRHYKLQILLNQKEEFTLHHFGTLDWSLHDTHRARYVVNNVPTLLEGLTEILAHVVNREQELSGACATQVAKVR